MVYIYNEGAPGTARKSALVTVLKEGQNKWETCKNIYKANRNIPIRTAWELPEKQQEICDVIFAEVVQDNTDVFDLDGIKIAEYIHAP